MTKWHGVINPSLKLEWGMFGIKHVAWKKEHSFGQFGIKLWRSIRGEPNIANIGDKCHMCVAGILETIDDSLLGCRVARMAWDFSINNINIMKA